MQVFTATWGTQDYFPQLETCTPRFISSHNSVKGAMIYAVHIKICNRCTGKRLVVQEYPNGDIVTIKFRWQSIKNLKSQVGCGIQLL